MKVKDNTMKCGMIAALALGADGVYMGTRFITTHECDAHPKMKETVIRGGNVCTVSLNNKKR